MAQQARIDKPGPLAEPACCSSPSFVPLVTEAGPVAKVAASASPPAVIEIRLAGAVVGVVSGVDGELLTAVLRAVRRSSGVR